jgi:hypothetical protein
VPLISSDAAFSRGPARLWLLAIFAALALPAYGQTEASTAPAMDMAGLDGNYTLTREGSGTSWQPDSTPMSGLHSMQGAWMRMLHGFADLIYDNQGGGRGERQSFSTSMLMFMARRELGDGAFGVHLMASSDPAMGPSGYPLLFQTGETANGKDPLIDRQHPHDLLMEAAVSYSRNLSAASSAFVYLGLPGEPALGPNAFMHRLSGQSIPEAPLSHHWMDSTHIAWGVLTAGYTAGKLRLEASAFNGREPDQNRYDLEVRPLDSYATRLSYNPGPDWSLQGSFGRLASPEQLQPGVSVRRATASASYNAPLAQSWQTTLAWGRNSPSAGPASDAWLLESTASVAAAHTIFGRFEHVAKDELFVPGSALAGRNFMINKLSLGYIFDFTRWQSLELGLGGLVSMYSYPAELNAAYGTDPVSCMGFVRARL